MDAHDDIASQLMTYGLAVREARGRRHWLQADVATRLGVSTNTIRKIEAGAEGTAYGTILRLSQLLNISSEPREFAATPSQRRFLEQAAPRRVNRASHDPALEF